MATVALVVGEEEVAPEEDVVVEDVEEEVLAPGVKIGLV